MRIKNICVYNGKIWEKAELHLKSAIPDFDHHNLAKLIELDLLKQQIK